MTTQADVSTAASPDVSPDRCRTICVRVLACSSALLMIGALLVGIRSSRPVRIELKSEAWNASFGTPQEGVSNLTNSWMHACIRKEDAKRVSQFKKTGGKKLHWMRDYKLGDCIKLLKCRNAIRYADSIGAKYAARAQKARNNLTLLLSILHEFDNRKGFEKPRRDTLVVHLRLGDVIEKSQDSVFKMLTRGGNPAHHAKFANAIKSIPELLANAKEVGVKQIVLVGGFHLQGAVPKSIVYTACIGNAFKRVGYKLELRLNGCPDEDFYFMAHAQKLVVSAGGFSRLVGNLAEMLGGQVVGRRFL